jgi:hypothetical protein
MPKNFSQKTFDYWLKQNKKYFHYQPQLFRHFRNHSIYSFHGINPAIQIYIYNTGSVEIWINYKGVFWDIIVDLDVYEQRTPTGTYFCHLCPKDEQIFYPTRQDLWIDHSFKPLLEWSLEHLVASNRLCLLELGDQSSAAFISPLDKIKEKQNKMQDLLEAFSDGQRADIVLPVVI